MRSMPAKAETSIKQSGSGQVEVCEEQVRRFLKGVAGKMKNIHIRLSSVRKGVDF